MKLNTLFLATAFSASAFASGTTDMMCGYISQEAEGTWLDVPVNAADPLTTHTTYSLLGAGVDSLEQDAKVCVEYDPFQGDVGINTVEVISVQAWK